MRVSLFGYGKTTRALAKLFEHVTFYDDNCHKPFKDPDGYQVAPSSLFDPRYSDLEIPSPGVPPSHQLIQQAKNLQSEYDFFSDIMPRSIWISGTNGKTTTTQMLTHLLEDKDVQNGGNIGTPLAQMDPKRSLWILETSSFTLHYTNKATPDIYLLLPIKPDHISWHGSFEAYEADKLKPLYTLQEGEVAIVPKQYESIQTDGMLIGYEDATDLADYFGIDIDKIKFRGAFLLDAVLAMAVDKILFDRIAYTTINSFSLDPHRQELFFDQEGRRWINDTKATNIDATIACIENFLPEKIHLILGGDDKGVSLDELFCYLDGKDITTYHIGSNTQRLNDYAKRFSIKHYECNELKKAVDCIKQNLTQESIAILSPAAASLDQFRSYSERGELFKRYVLE